jgi:hypothetical protein
MGITALTDIRISPGDITITTAMMGTAMGTGTMGTGDLICITTAMMGTAMGTGDRICISTAGTAGNDGALYSAELSLEDVARCKPMTCPEAQMPQRFDVRCIPHRLSPST